jgi:hypothetical protein
MKWGLLHWTSLKIERSKAFTLQLRCVIRPSRYCDHYSKPASQFRGQPKVLAL